MTMDVDTYLHQPFNHYLLRIGSKSFSFNVEIILGKYVRTFPTNTFEQYLPIAPIMARKTSIFNLTFGNCQLLIIFISVLFFFHSASQQPWTSGSLSEPFISFCFLMVNDTHKILCCPGIYIPFEEFYLNAGSASI